MSDVRPELQQIREALDFDCGTGPWPCGCLSGDCGRQEAAHAALARVEATLNTRFGYSETVAAERKALQYSELLTATEARVVAAEAELAKRDNRLEMVRANLRHIAVSLPRAVLRQKLEDLAALAEPVSATGASGALHDPATEARELLAEWRNGTDWQGEGSGQMPDRVALLRLDEILGARPAHAEPPPEPIEGVALTPEQILHVQRKTLAAPAPIEPPERPETP